MNAYLLSTALLSVGVDAPITSNAINSAVFNNPYENQHMLAEALQTDTSRDFAKGDFTVIARSTTSGPLYTGDGAVQMVSARQFRH